MKSLEKGPGCNICTANQISQTSAIVLATTSQLVVQNLEWHLYISHQNICSYLVGCAGTCTSQCSDAALRQGQLFEIDGAVADLGR